MVFIKIVRQRESQKKYIFPSIKAFKEIFRLVNNDSKNRGNQPFSGVHFQFFFQNERTNQNLAKDLALVFEHLSCWF